MKAGIVTGMLLALALVVYLCIAGLGGFLNGLIEHSAQAEIARGQAAALVEQAAAQGDLLRAQAAITNQAAMAVAADRQAAHGATPAQAAAVAVAVCAVAGAIAYLLIELRRARLQLRAMKAQLADGEVQDD